MKDYNGELKLTSPLIFALLLLIFTLPTFAPLSYSAEDVYESRLDRGLKNNEPYSYVLIKKANANPSSAKSLLAEAIKYSPDLPPAYFEMAKTSFSPSAGGMFESLDYAIKGFKAYKKNFWWLISLTGLFTASLMLFYEGNIISAETRRKVEANRFGKLFLKKGLIKEEDLQKALDEQQSKGIPYPPFITPLIFLVSLLIAIISSPSQRSDNADRIRTSADIDNIRFIIEAFKYENGSYPQSIYQITKTADSWGRQYIYKPAADDFVLFSAGTDGKEGTADDVY